MAFGLLAGLLKGAVVKPLLKKAAKGAIGKLTEPTGAGTGAWVG